MTRAVLERATVARTATLREALESIDRSGLHVALLLREDGALAGLLTDGDLRRAILAGADLSAPALDHATTAPQTVELGSSRALVLDLMRARRISAVPEVADDGRVVGLHTLSDVVGVQPMPNPAVIMAGGRGTRLGALTRNTPKPLLEVAGRSILEWIVLNLVGGGITDIHVSVNHLADQVEEHLGDGSRLGCHVTYLREDPERPLGTAGSLALLHAARPDLDVPVLVMNGDLMVQFEPSRLLDFHAGRGAAITVATRSYQHEVPFGVVETGADAVVTGIREKPTLSMTINAGVYVVSPAVLAGVPKDRPCTMPELVQSSLDAGAPVAAWALASDWIDVGVPADLARAKGIA
jgi:dTDP-glucose pyrophosphorylase